MHWPEALQSMLRLVDVMILLLKIKKYQEVLTKLI